MLKIMCFCICCSRYYQVARCYRDERTKPERQPEFTQLDIELSFTSQQSVMSLIEDLSRYVLDLDLFEIPDEPFPRLTYAEAMLKYGTDKPNTGGFVWIIDFPLFIAKENDENGTTKAVLESAHHPFTLPTKVEDLYENPLKVRSTKIYMKKQF